MRILIVIFSLFPFALSVDTIHPQSISVLHFGTEGTLFVADSLSGSIFAYQNVEAKSKVQEQPYNLPNIAHGIAALLGTSSDNIMIMDLAVHPASQEAFVGVQRVEADKYVPAMVIVDQCGSMRTFDLEETPHTSVQFEDTIEEDFWFWGKVNGRRLTFTDMELYNGKLYVAGLSNGPFQASLRMVDYDGEDFGANGVATIEMYHGNHAQNETRAPIRTFTILTLSDGKDYILAAYTCTPLVIFPLEEFKDGAHIIGKTIAELGYGNTPVDILDFMSMDENMTETRVVFLSNKDQSSQLFYIKAIEESNAKEGIVDFAFYQNKGTVSKNVPMAGIMHVADQDSTRLLGIRREGESGALELVSFQKGLYFRLDDFQSEFEFPDYNYPEPLSPEMTFLKDTQDKLTLDTGIVKEEL